MTATNKKVKDANQGMHTKQSTRATFAIQGIDYHILPRTNSNMRWMHVRKQEQLNIVNYRTRNRIDQRAFFDGLIFVHHPEYYLTSQAGVLLQGESRQR